MLKQETSHTTRLTLYNTQTFCENILHQPSHGSNSLHPGTSIMQPHWRDTDKNVHIIVNCLVQQATCVPNSPLLSTTISISPDSHDLSQYSPQVVAFPHQVHHHQWHPHHTPSGSDHRGDGHHNKVDACVPSAQFQATM